MSVEGNKQTKKVTFKTFNEKPIKKLLIYLIGISKNISNALHKNNIPHEKGKQGGEC